MASLFILMCMTTVDTMTRRTFIGGVTDSMNFTELFMLFIIFGGLGYLETKRGHIRVDLFVNWMPRIPKKITETTMYLLTTGVLFMFTYGLFIRIFDDMESGAATQLLAVPTWPFTTVAMLMILIYSITALLHLLEIVFEVETEKKDDDDVSLGTIAL